MRIFGIDFTSAPRPAKPITVAHARPAKQGLWLEKIERIETFDAFEEFLRRPGPWVGGFDFPFGLPRELLRDLGWPRDWRRLTAFCAALSRSEWRGILDGYRATRAAGRKYAHRATDLPAGSSSPMKLVNPPVALMFHEGAPRLADAGVHIPGLADGDRSRVALEAYPGLFARKLLGRTSYKSDTKSKHSSERRLARLKIFDALDLKTSPRLKRVLLEDGSGDSLDAAICAAQAAWGWRRRARGFGLPRRVPACEGWIVGA
jgi:hypothetical protein